MRQAVTLWETVSWIYLNSYARFNHSPFKLTLFHIVCIFQSLSCLSLFNTLRHLQWRAYALYILRTPKCLSYALPGTCLPGISHLFYILQGLWDSLCPHSSGSGKPYLLISPLTVPHLMTVGFGPSFVLALQSFNIISFIIIFLLSLFIRDLIQAEVHGHFSWCPRQSVGSHLCLREAGYLKLL